MLSQRLCTLQPLQPFMESSKVFHAETTTSTKDVSASITSSSGIVSSKSLHQGSSCRSQIKAGAATAALLSSQTRKRKATFVTSAPANASESRPSDIGNTSPTKCISNIESKKSKLASNGDSKEDDVSKANIIGPLQFLEGLFSSISGGIDTIRTVQSEHKNKMVSRCNSSPPQCDINSYNVEMVRAVQGGEVSKLERILKQQKQEQQQQKSLKDGETTVNVFNACNRFGESLLHMACRRGHYEIVKFLLQDAAVTIDRYDDYGRTPLHDAFWTTQPNFTIADLLIRNCSPHLLVTYDVRGHTPFHYARTEHHGAWTTFLRQHRSILMQRISLYLSTVSMTNAGQHAVPAAIAVQKQQLQATKEEAKKHLLSSANGKKDTAASTLSNSCKLSSTTNEKAVNSTGLLVNPIAVLSVPQNMLIPGQIKGQQSDRKPSDTPSSLTGIQTPFNAFPANQQKHLHSILQPVLQQSGVAAPPASLQLLSLPMSQSQQQQKQLTMLLPTMSNTAISLNGATFPMVQQQIHPGQSIVPFPNQLFPASLFQAQNQTLPQINTINHTAPTTPNQSLIMPPHMYVSSHPSIHQLPCPIFVVNNQSPSHVQLQQPPFNTTGNSS
jgi:Ankyrin repeats (3 copies)